MAIKMITCPACHGSGKCAQKDTAECPSCNYNDGGKCTRDERCRSCGGSGEVPYSVAD